MAKKRMYIKRDGIKPFNLALPEHLFSALRDVAGPRGMTKAITEAVEDYLITTAPTIKHIDTEIEIVETEISFITAKLKKLEKQRSELMMKAERLRAKKRLIMERPAAIEDILRHSVNEFLAYVERAEQRDTERFMRMGGSYLAAVPYVISILEKKIDGWKNEARLRGVILTKGIIEEEWIKAAKEKDAIRNSKASQYIRR